MPPHHGGVERVAQQMAGWYSDAGHDVRWLATGAGGTDRDGQIQRERVPAFNALERRFGMPFPIPGPAGLRRIAAVAREADLVHLHDCLYLPILAADRGARRGGAPTLVTQHVGMVGFGGGIDPLLFTAYRTVGRRVLRRAAKVAFVNEGVRSWFHERIDPALPSEHIPNAVDLEHFHPASPAERTGARRAFGIPVDVPVVLFVGRLVAKKNPALIVDALRRIEGPLRALFVGDGPLRGALASLGDRCTHVTELPHAQMSLAYAAADVFVLPSRDEGTPLTVLEALAAGLPIVVSDDLAFSELDGCRGVVRVPAHAEPVATAVRAALAGGGIPAGASRAWAEAHYGEPRIAARYLEIAAELTAPARDRRRGPGAWTG